MKISNDVFEGIIGHPTATADAKDKNRRTHRIAVSKRATFCHAGSAVRVPITIIDFSLGGVRFIHLSPLLPSEQFILHIAGRDGDQVTVHCLVRWCTKTSSGRFRVGSEFLRLIDNEEALQPLATGRA
jgi:hypothetical protein